MLVSSVKALRRADFVRERRWRGDAKAFCALWFPK